MEIVTINRNFTDPVDYWKYVIAAIASQTEKPLTDKELEILAHIMILGHEYPFFNQPRKNLLVALRVKEQTLSMHKKSLIEKTFITEDGKLSSKLLPLRGIEKMEIQINFKLS